MSTKNGAKQFLYVVRHSSGFNGFDRQYMMISCHDPSEDELIALLKLNHDPECDTIEAQRYDLDALPTLPPK